MAGGNDFGDRARQLARQQKDFERAIAKSRESPDEVLELINFACGAAMIAGDPDRQAIQFILPNGRQVIAKIRHEHALQLADAISFNAAHKGELENGAEPSGS
jgi:hypothetical protein